MPKIALQAATISKQHVLYACNAPGKSDKNAAKDFKHKKFGIRKRA